MMRGRGRPLQARPGTHQPTREGDELSRNVDHMRRQADRMGPFGDGVRLTNVALTTTAKEVRHGLGRVPRGWIVTDRDAQATVRRSGWTKQAISLLSSANVTVDLWVF